MNQDSAALLWRCPPATTNPSGPDQWWCGDEGKTAPCQTGIDADFVSYTSASALVISSRTSTLSSAATDISTQPSALSLSSSINPSSNGALLPQTQRGSASLTTETCDASTNHASMSTVTSVQNQPQSSSLPIAIGAGIGVPLGIAAIGFLGFLFSRDAKLKKDKRKPVIPSADSGLKPNTDESSRGEEHNTHLLHELMANDRAELSSTAARRIL